MMPVTGKYNHNQILEFFQLAYHPFPVAPDDTDFFVSPHNDLIITNLTRAILSRRGFLLLTGDIGLGKTTISRRVIRILDDNKVETALVFHSFFQKEELLKEIIRDFGILVDDQDNTISKLMVKLNAFLLEKNKDKINCAIIIDDAQNLSCESLELIRMLSNLETDKEKLVQILLVGQPELIDTLNNNKLRQLKSRITLVQNCVPLQNDQIKKYVQFKLNMAGDTGKVVLSGRAARKLYRLTSGNLRKINVLMDHALQLGAANNTCVLKHDYFDRAHNALHFGKETKNVRLSLALVIILIVIIFVGIGAGTSVFYFQQLEITEPAVPEPDASKVIAPESIVSKSVISFLSAYGLTSFSQSFQKALDENQFEKVTALILDKTGFQLVSLDTLPEFVKGKYHILSGGDQESGKITYYLFWKPLFKIDRFFYRYSGQEIIKLQKLLYDMMLYDYDIDGIVGHRILKSVKDFQKLNHLPETGFPDLKTVFLLVNAARG